MRILNFLRREEEMGVKVNIYYPHLQQFTDNQEVVKVNGSTVGECLYHLVQQFPAVGKGIFDEHGKLLNYVDIYVNQESSYPEELAKPVMDGDKLSITLMIAGG